MRIKLDENLHPDVAGLLKTNGHDALTVWDQNLRGSSDTTIASVVQREDRVLMTLDLDF
jgi:predicted nuclease of predicted toxin-antitoxin system